MFIVVKEARVSVRFAPSSKGDRAPSGSGRIDHPSLGSGEALPAPKGSDVPNLRPRGRVSRNLPSGGRVKPRSRPLTVCLILIVGDSEFPFFGYPKIGTRQAA
jgi:hypothetical protein